MDRASELRLKLICPQVAAKVRELADTLLKIGIEIRITQGMRSWVEQDRLYAKGRTEPGPKVTNAIGGMSWHNFGLAVDVVPDDISITGFQCDWNVQHPAWRIIVHTAESMGFTSGAEFRTFPDWPHLQITGRFPVGAPDDEARQIFRAGGMAAVWAEVFSPAAVA